GKTMPTFKPALSDTTQTAHGSLPPVDHLWQRLGKQYDLSDGYVSISFPKKKADIIRIDHSPEWGTYYKRQIRAYDQYSLKDITTKSSFSETFENAEIADKIKRMNYDIHVGAILGLPGKILAFFASLICASLPITGFYIWWGRKKKNKKPANKRASAQPGVPRVKIPKTTVTE
ncbi:MAG: PepSY-associated TM helix domain-containing protein, partial [Siphonobacter sp.]